jgi:hypothetical protein
MNNTLRQNLLKPDVAIRHKFLYNSIDYTDLMLTTGLSVTRNVNLSAGLMPIVLNNAGGWWNFLFETNTALGEVAEIQLYVSGDESNTLTLFKGFVKDPIFEAATVRLMVKDHTSAWLERTVGSNENPARVLQGSADWAVVADHRAWSLLTDSRYGNLDDTDNPLNLDIDYVSFAAWRDQHIRPNSYELRGKSTGQTVGELLICQMTHSYIWVNNDGKVAFAPPYNPGHSYDESNTGSKAKPGIGRDLNIVTRNIINNVSVRYSYNYDDGTWGTTDVSDSDATSIAQFNNFPKTVETRVFFHHNVASATSDRDATLVDYAYPIRFFNLIAGVPALMEDLGRQITVSDTLKGISGVSANVEEITYNLDTFEVRIKARWPW